MRKEGKDGFIPECKNKQELKQLKSTVVNKLRDKDQIEPKGVQLKLKIFNLDKEEMNFEEDKIEMIIKQNHLD